MASNTKPSIISISRNMLSITAAAGTATTAFSTGFLGLTFTHIERGVEIGPNCEVGPFVHLRPGTVLEEGASIGNFVEIKASRLGPAAKLPQPAEVLAKFADGPAMVLIRRSAAQSAAAGTGAFLFLGGIAGSLFYGW